MDNSFYKNIPVELVYGILAVAGGIARYLNTYVKGGHKFNLAVLLASTFMSGFSGYMFALLGRSLSMPENVLFIMAGVGGFFGDQTLRLIMDYITPSKSHVK